MTPTYASKADLRSDLQAVVTSKTMDGLKTMEKQLKSLGIKPWTEIVSEIEKLGLCY